MAGHVRKPRFSQVPEAGFLPMAALAAALIVPSLASALPQSGQTVAGSATIATSGTAMTVSQSTQRLILDWQSFGIAADEQVRFAQPDANSTALNRVLGNEASNILGRLESNGRVFLTNPNGIHFASGAQVDVGSLVASTLGISNEDFLAGNFRFTGTDGGTITNAGELNAAIGGAIALLAPQVRNEGIIVAREGAVAIGAGTVVTLYLGNGIRIEVEQSALNAAIENRHAVRAPGGLVLFTASAQQDFLAGSINNTGVVEAGGVENVGGTIRLTAGFQSLGGTLDASGTSGGNVQILARNVDLYGDVAARGSDASGGSVTFTGDRIVQTSASQVDASGNTGGGVLRVNMDAIDERGGAVLSGAWRADANAGNGGDILVTGRELTLSAATLSANGGGAGNGGGIRIGGDFQGANPLVANAQTTRINGSTTISANAGTTGNGGRVIVWSDAATAYSGSISARGGENGGNGGFVEVSGKENLGFAGNVDVLAPRGTTGQLLLDPKNIVISAAGTLPVYELFDPNPADGNDFGRHLENLGENNVMVTSLGDDFIGTDGGAVYVFNVRTGALVSTLRQDPAGCLLGTCSNLEWMPTVRRLATGNLVMQQQTNVNNHFGQPSVYATTFVDAEHGVSGVLGATTSLLQNSQPAVLPMSNGNYLISADNALTWGDGHLGVRGVVSAELSLLPAPGHVFDDLYIFRNGNYLVRSRGTDLNDSRGAVTWGSALGIRGMVSVENSLLGGYVRDQVGFGGVLELANGNFVIGSPYWNNGRGAATFGSGTTGVRGVVSAENSLVGSRPGDHVGQRMDSGWNLALSNGNYVVGSPLWDRDGIVDAGAVTWGNGETGVSGEISIANSLVGVSAGDRIGARTEPPAPLGGVPRYDWTSIGPGALTNGNYVITSPFWDNGTAADAGAVTWGDGSTGSRGEVGAHNSLVGSQTGDKVGSDGIAILGNGHFVVASKSWDNGGIVDAGAVTWGNGRTGSAGVISATNSLVGSSPNDWLGALGHGEAPYLYDVRGRNHPVIAELANGNYLVASSNWDNAGATDAGAVTWAPGEGGIQGEISAANSLVGDKSGDRVGCARSYTCGVSLFRFANSNYLIISSSWQQEGIGGVGAVTFGNGATGVSGVVSPANSLVGSTLGDMWADPEVRSVGNDHALLINKYWDRGDIVDAGAITWFDGVTPVIGAISPLNSLVGRSTDDQLGGFGWFGSGMPHEGGFYAISSPYWHDDAGVQVGAVTLTDGNTPLVGEADGTNSIVGSRALDTQGAFFYSVDGGGYVLTLPRWDNGDILDAGALLVIDPAVGLVGAVNETNALVGTSPGQFLTVSDGFQIFSGTETGYGTDRGLPSSGVLFGANLADHDGLVDVGALAWISGHKPVSGTLSNANAVFGSVEGERLGYLLLGARGPNIYNEFEAFEGEVGFSGGLSSAHYELGSYPNRAVEWGSRGAGQFVIPAGRTDRNAHSIKVLDLDGEIDFAQAAGQDLAIHPGFIAGLISDGTHVTLQASNDISVLDEIRADHAQNQGGDLTLQAGRSMLIEAGIFTDGGDIRLIANELPASGVQSADRDAGAANLAIRGELNAGAGDVFLHLRDGHTNTDGLLTLAAPVTGNTVRAIADNGRGLVLRSTVTSTVNTGTGIELVAPVFTNTAGANALQTATDSRWLVWSTNPALDLRGNLPYRFKQYDAVYGETPVLGAGNGLLYSVAPTLTLQPFTGNITKVYDGNTSVTSLIELGATGMIDGDATQVRINDADYADRHVGQNKPVTFASANVVATHGDRPVYGYRVVEWPSLAGSITPKPISATGIIALDKRADGTTVAQLDTSAAGLLGVIEGDSVLLDSANATGSFANPNYGTDKPVTVHGLLLTQTDAGNYQLLPYTTVADIYGRLITVIIHDEKIRYGTPLPAFTYHLQGLEPGEDPATITGITLSSNAPEKPKPGVYRITGSTAPDSNYEFRFENGKLIVLGYGTGDDHPQHDDDHHGKKTQALLTQPAHMQLAEAMQHLSVDSGAMRLPDGWGQTGVQHESDKDSGRGAATDTSDEDDERFVR